MSENKVDSYKGRHLMAISELFIHAHILESLTMCTSTCECIQTHEETVDVQLSVLPKSHE